MLGKQRQARNSLTVGKHLPMVAVGSRQPSPRAVYYRTIQYVYWIISFVRVLPRLCPAARLAFYLFTWLHQATCLADTIVGRLHQWTNGLVAKLFASWQVCVCES